MSLKKIIPFVTTAALMVLIFMFSAQNGDDSAHLSTSVTKMIVDFLHPAKSAMERTREIAQLNGIIRKCAHFSVYAALGISAAAMFRVILRNKRPLKISLAAVLFCAVYASTDEVHQFFSDGRGPQVTDVCLDTFGALCGSQIYTFLRRLRHKDTNEFGEGEKTHG